MNSLLLKFQKPYNSVATYLSAFETDLQKATTKYLLKNNLCNQIEIKKTYTLKPHSENKNPKRKSGQVE